MEKGNNLDKTRKENYQFSILNHTGNNAYNVISSGQHTQLHIFQFMHWNHIVRVLNTLSAEHLESYSLVRFLNNLGLTLNLKCPLSVRLNQMCSSAAAISPYLVKGQGIKNMTALKHVVISQVDSSQQSGEVQTWFNRNAALSWHMPNWQKTFFVFHKNIILYTFRVKLTVIILQFWRNMLIGTVHINITDGAR